MWLSRVSSESKFCPHATHLNTCRSDTSSLISFTGETFRDNSMPGPLVFSSWGRSEVLWLFPLCIFRPLSDLKAFPQISQLNVFTPCCGSSAAGWSTSTSENAVEGFCFLCKNAALRLAFLLSVDGLDFFLVLPWVAKTRPLSLVSREKENVELTEREKLKAKPWPASVWQKSRHLAAKEESLSPTAVILVYFWIKNLLEGPENLTCLFKSHLFNDVKWS